MEPIKYIKETTLIKIECNNMNGCKPFVKYEIKKREETEKFSLSIFNLALANRAIQSLSNSTYFKVEFNGSWLSLSNTSFTAVFGTWCNPFDLKEGAKVEELPFLPNQKELLLNRLFKLSIPEYIYNCLKVNSFFCVKNELLKDHKIISKSSISEDLFSTAEDPFTTDELKDDLESTTNTKQKKRRRIIRKKTTVEEQ